jgi:hypothetical protein
VVTDIDQLIDDTLAAAPGLEPTPYFASRVMLAVRRDAELPPLPFPLKRIAAALLLLVAGVVGGVVASAPDRAVNVTVPAPHAALAALVCLAVTAFSIELRRRLAR